MPIDMQTLANDIKELREEVAADQILIKIAMGHLKSVKFIDEDFMQGILDGANTDLAKHPYKDAILAKLELRIKSIFPKK